MENAHCEKMSRISGSGSEVDSLQTCNTAMENPDDEKVSQIIGVSLMFVSEHRVCLHRNQY
jgi:hypothetical protein